MQFHILCPFFSHNKVPCVIWVLKNPENIENQDSEGYVLLNSLSDLVTDYEQVHFPIQEIEKE